MSIYTAGLNNVGSFQVSGIPFATGSVNCTTATKITFPFVTSWVYIVNNGATDARVGFSQAGVQDSKHFTVHTTGTNGKEATTAATLHLKLSEIWVSGSNSIDIVAGLTNIPVDRITAISPSGSNWSGSVGVG
jgi:hypothetical protein